MHCSWRINDTVALKKYLGWRESIAEQETILEQDQSWRETILEQDTSWQEYHSRTISKLAGNHST
jgi:hypothetical protein